MDHSGLDTVDGGYWREGNIGIYAYTIQYRLNMSKMDNSIGGEEFGAAMEVC